MAIKEIIKYPNPLLRQKTKPVIEFDESLKELINDLAETMYDAPGAGLAANQIGISIQVVIIDMPSSTDEDKREFLALINPEISDCEGSQVGEEGCLSVVDFSADVKRYQKIRVKAQSPDGKVTEFEAEDHFARVIQHEVDHLNGVLFIDHISSLKRALYKKKLKKILKEKQAANDNK